MSKRTLFTTVTPLPDGITRQTVLETLHNHLEMIDLNPLVTDRHPIKPPPEASAEEYHAQWYSVTDKVNYLPGGLYSGAVSFNCCFHDLPNGLQTHIYAPMGLNMKGRWTLGGTLPGEPREPVELGLGLPKTGLWLREDVDMKCNFVMTKFVKGTTKKTHAKLVARLLEKAHLVEAHAHNSALANNALAEQLSLREQYPPDYHAGISSPVQPNSQYFDGKPLDMPPTTSPAHTPPVGAHGSYPVGPNLGSPRFPPSALNQSTGSPGYVPPPMNQSYFTPHGQQDSKAPYQSYHTSSYPAPHGNAGTMHQHPSQLTTAGLAAELPSQDARTPIELDNHHR